MKLELKHLSPYLPYGLKMKIGYVDKVVSLLGLQIGNHAVNNILVKFKYKKDYLAGYLYECKPILHPPSDLTKKIEVNGEKFVPIEKIKHLLGYKCKVSINYDGNLIFKVLNGQYLFYSDFGDVQNILLESHFDIFGLIENNLAIDINTLKS